MPEKIVHIITRLELGGAQQNTLYTLENLQKGRSGFLVAGRGGYLDSTAKKSGKYSVSFCPFLVRKVFPSADILAFFWIYFYLLSLKPAVVHTHSSKAGIIGRWAAYFARVPVIIHTFHGFGFTPLQKPFVRKSFIFLERITATLSDVLITVARDNIRKALAERIGKKSQYIVIHSGIDIKKFEKAKEFANIKNNLGIKPSEKVVGNISCFKPQKGLEVFVRACAELKTKGDYRFVLAGDGVLRDKIEKLICEHGLTDEIILSGWVDGAEKVLPAMDVMLHTAYFEGLPRVFPEAMACGVPVVATEVDGASDIIIDGVNGFLAAPGDYRALAAKTYELLENRDLRKKIADEARRRLKEDFDIRKMSENLNELYKSELNKKENI